jgi:hypothetical protein
VWPLPWLHDKDQHISAFTRTDKIHPTGYRLPERRMPTLLWDSFKHHPAFLGSSPLDSGSAKEVLHDRATSITIHDQEPGTCLTEHRRCSVGFMVSGLRSPPSCVSITSTG